MRFVHDPAKLAGLADPDVRRFVHTRVRQVAGDDEWVSEQHGMLIVVDPGDTVDQLERESGVALLRDAFGDTRYGHPDFVPGCEALEDYGFLFEMTFVLNDDGYGVIFFIPKQDGVDAELLSMCATFAASARD
jgi:hypothetical protein